MKSITNFLWNRVIKKHNIGTTSSVNQVISEFNDASVIIIGAGLAGLTAAKYLQQKNFTNVKILEASERYGGRIETKKFGDISVELGAKNISTLKNSFPIIEEYLSFDSLRHLNTKHFFVQTNGRIIPADLDENVTNIFNYILKNFKLNKNTLETNKSKNVKEFLETETENKSKTLFGKESQTASALFQALISDLQSFYGCDMSYVNIENLRKMLNIYINSTSLSHGMIDSLTPLIDDVNHKILFNKPVIKINYVDGEVTCLGGTKFRADHIICTLPLGHLKAYASILFRPQLPKEKLHSIEKLGVSTPENIYIEFKDSIETWFPVGCIYPLWTSEESIDRRPFYKNITAVYRPPESKHVLQINCCKGHECRANENAILEDVNKFLEIFSKKPKNIPIANILKSNWSTDPKFLGGIPYLTDSNSKTHIKELSNPIYWKLSANIEKPALMFAGDATEINGFGTVESAINSGVREAKRLVDYYEKKSFTMN